MRRWLAPSWSDRCGGGGVTSLKCAFHSTAAFFAATGLGPADVPGHQGRVFACAVAPLSLDRLGWHPGHCAICRRRRLYILIAVCVRMLRCHLMFLYVLMPVKGGAAKLLHYDMCRELSATMAWHNSCRWSIGAFVMSQQWYASRGPQGDGRLLRS